MHTHGTHARTTIEHKDGTSECMVDIPKWDFHWQGTYAFSQPKTFKPGDALNVECHWSNLSPTALNWGETTEDEMCLSLIYATQ
jgi:hypothetical protein